MAFAECDFINTVVIPNMPVIEECAFMGCENLTSVTLGDGVDTIGEQAFYNCYSLSNIDFGNTVSKIGHAAFSGCYNLTSVTLPTSLKTIDNNSFELCGLTSIVIPENVENVYQDAFSECSSLESITFEGMNCNISGHSKVGYTIPRDTFVRGYWGSTAEKYAEEWYLDFEAIGNGNSDNSTAEENALAETEVSSVEGTAQQ